MSAGGGRKKTTERDEFNILENDEQKAACKYSSYRISDKTETMKTNTQKTSHEGSSLLHYFIFLQWT